ncbi:hypothetical protein CABS01_10854 [Colletotrichum abscissum]|uniref:uncharacterized protein n=1 Tax=Colletotrichum abscissum TaxID=1671311 RepID=UPI0027D59B17|nr:uncharacterized protein CABS01_10854 [Colletotrichum abscissum]KAK1497876.1 hypothetical protein CABS01_10854 [Colletotrichum abscissum]
MPRPPVRPEDRKRSTRACTACRATKKRCDAAQPCRPCVKRGVGSSCTYSQHVRARRAPPNQSSAASGTRQRDQVSPLLYQRQESSLQDENETAGSSTSGKTVTPPGPRPVMMYTCSGEKGTISISSAASATILRRRLLCLYVMVAIGAQCRGQIGDAPKAFRYFSEARKLSFEGMLSDPTLNTARGFVLMAFYMFGACRRNSAFMYLGVATKAASVMGLHMAEQFQSLSESERSLRIVDTLTEESELGMIRAQQFLDEIRHWNTSLMDDHDDEGGGEDEKSVAELSDACVDAAVFMAEMCADALDSRTIMGNMCILK